MAKTSPIGVRFEKELLDALKESDETITPQKALSIYEECFMREVSLINKKSFKPIFIYKLVNPLTNKAFYIGRTTFFLHQRLGLHIGQRNSKAQGVNQVKSEVINGIISAGQKPTIELIETITPIDDYEYRGHHEREVFWIAKYTLDGHPLTNKIPDKAKTLMKAISEEGNKTQEKIKINTEASRREQAHTAERQPFMSEAIRKKLGI